MTMLIRGGTVVNHDASRRADVLIEGGGSSPSARIWRRRPAPRSSMPAAPMCCPAASTRTRHCELAFMGYGLGRRFRVGDQGGALRRHDDDRGFLHPGARRLDARRPMRDWRSRSEKAACDYGFHMAVTSWSKSRFDEMATVVNDYGINTFKHFMAYKGALMVRRRGAAALVLALRRARRHAAGPCRERRRGGACCRQNTWRKGVTGPEGHALSRPPEVEGEAANRAIMIADMAGSPALHRPYQLPRGA